MLTCEASIPLTDAGRGNGDWGQIVELSRLNVMPTAIVEMLRAMSTESARLQRRV